MQVDFSLCTPEPQQFYGWLEKLGSLRGNWKSRYFLLSDGFLKYYSKPPQAGTNDVEGVELRGELNLQGSTVALEDEVLLHIAKGDKKNAKVTTLKAPNSDEAREWLSHLNSEIVRRNIMALQAGSRLPEIVSWYYQYQEEVYERTQFLENEIEIVLIYQTPGKAGGKLTSNFLIEMVKDRSGLALRLNQKKQGEAMASQKPNREDSLNNGRVLLFSDILGVFLPSGSWSTEGNMTKPFAFTLITKEDQMSCEVDAKYIPWLKAVQQNVTFLFIPKPVARSSSSAVDSGQLSTLHSLLEFSANSGSVFSSSSEVQLILESFNSYADKCSLITDIGTHLSTLLKLIPDVKSNKEALNEFGERMEEVVRTLGDPDTGIIVLARVSDKNLLNYHLSTLNVKLNDTVTYLSTQCRIGWMAKTLTKSNEAAKYKLESLDNDITYTLNALSKALGLNMDIETHDYDTAVDVKDSVEALGGVEAIFNDSAKERALARLIQADGFEVHLELEAIVASIQSRGGDVSGYRSSRNSGNSIADKIRSSILGDDDEASVTGGRASREESCLKRFFCCCCIRRSRAEAKKNSLKYSGSERQRTSSIQLKESLVKNQHLQQS